MSHKPPRSNDVSTDATRVAVGIDPGLGWTGIVYVVQHGKGARNLVGYHLLTDEVGRGEPTVVRIHALATRILDRIMSELSRLQPDHVSIAIETPIYNRNPDAFQKQWGLFFAIETLIAEKMILPLVYPTIHMCEPGPSESKKLATGSGSASKREIFDNSPFAWQTLEGLDEDQLYTLSDAWAHSLAAFGNCNTNYVLFAQQKNTKSVTFIDYPVYELKAVSYGSFDGHEDRG